MILCALTNAIEAYHECSVSELILLNTAKDKDHVKISIIDGGNGVSQSNHHLILEDGYTTKKFGSGKGLRLIKLVATKHFKGNLDIKSQVRSGTTVELKIPIT